MLLKSSCVIIGAARTYFLTLPASSEEFTFWQIKENTMCGNYFIHSVCMSSTSLTDSDKETLMKVLLVEFMLSEETASESGSGEDMMTRRKIFLSKPLEWRSTEVMTYFASLDRKVDRPRSQREQEMC